MKKKLNIKKFYPYQDYISTLDHGIVAGEIQTGISYCLNAIAIYHATGLYPKNWKGKKFNKPTDILIVNSNVMELNVNSFLFDIKYDSCLLDGYFINEMDFKGTDRVLLIKIKHYNSEGEYDGYSKIYLKNSDEELSSFNGNKLDVSIIEGEIEENIFKKIIKRTRKKGIWLQGITYSNNYKPDILKHSRIRVKWEEAKHLTKEIIEFFKSEGH